MRVLEDAGLLQREVKGREHHCSLDAAPLSAAADYTNGYVRFWEERLDSLEAYLRSGTTKSRKKRRSKR